MAKKAKAKKEKMECCTEEKCCKGFSSMCNGGGLYCLAAIGAVVYYISTATGFWNGVWGVIKALLWPAFLIYEVLRFLGA